MLDLAGILFSTVMMLIVIVRAVQLDRIQPWFQLIARNNDASKSTPRSWQRHR